MGFLKDKEVGKRLEALRGEKSSRKIAMQAGIDPSQYVKIEKGELSITENILNKIIAEYGWNEDFILFGHGTSVPRGTSENEKDQTYATILELAKALAKHAETINSQQYIIRKYIDGEPDIGTAKNR